MRRSGLILLAGIILAIAAYCGLYRIGTAKQREVLQSSVPELAWLKKEFSLGDEEFDRISRLHAAYRPHCAEMCRRIDATNADLRELLSSANAAPSEIERKLEEASQIRLECQKAMLKHLDSGKDLSLRNRDVKHAMSPMRKI
jgi:hypothetical protein